jgi:hypothetical protein
VAFSAANATNPERPAVDPPVILNSNDWLNSGPWGVRIEIRRNFPAEGEYLLKAWVRQCDASCSNVLGTFFEDTRVFYEATEPLLEQSFTLSPADHELFERLLFGFTTATGAGQAQTTELSNIQLSFIRSHENDPVATTNE